MGSQRHLVPDASVTCGRADTGREAAPAAQPSSGKNRSAQPDHLVASIILPAESRYVLTAVTSLLDAPSGSVVVYSSILSKTSGTSAIGSARFENVRAGCLGVSGSFADAPAIEQTCSHYRSETLLATSRFPTAASTRCSPELCGLQHPAETAGIVSLLLDVRRQRQFPSPARLACKGGDRASRPFLFRAAPANRQ